MPQLDPSLFPTQIFWLVITFLALFLIAWKVALPRITEVLDARQTRIDGDLEKARTLKAEAEEAIAVYEKTLADATSEAQAIHRDTVQKLAEERTLRHEELSRKLSEQAREAENRIATEKERAVENIRDATLDVVQSAAQRLIGVTVAEADADRAVKAAMEENRS
ncbi:MAG: F0F1 ATP synthase subunit B' [Pseudomonadota bacterium]